MRVHLLIGHYKESYPGQLLPNVFLSCDETIMEENPSWWPENVSKEKAKCGGEVQAWAEIVVEVDEERMLDALYPSRHVIAAPVVDTYPEPHVGGWVKDALADGRYVQITTAPVTDGSLSSCPPAEAVTWGKVDKDTYQQSTESLFADYSMLMPFVVKALLEKHSVREPYRLFEKRDRLVSNLKDAVRKNGEWLMDSLRYPVAQA